MVVYKGQVVPDARNSVTRMCAGEPGCGSGNVHSGEPGMVILMAWPYLRE